MNFQITQGSGTTIGSDPVAGVNFQEIKLIDSTVGSNSPIGVAANPLKVSLEFTNTNTNPLTISGDVHPFPSYDRVTTGLMAGATDTVVIDTTGISTLGWTTSGNWIGTMTHEVQYGDGQWFIVETIDTNLANDGKPFVLTQWTEGLNNDPWITNVAGATQLRFRFVSYTSGSANIITNGSVGINATRVYNLTASILQTTARLNDGTGNAITSTTIGPKQALDVNIAGGVTIDVNLDHTTDNVLVYGNDGTTDQKIRTDVSGNTQVVGIGDFTVVQPTGTNLHTVVDSGSITVANATLAVTQSGVWTTGRTWTLASGTDSVSAVQSGTWNINNISGTISLPTGAATEATLSTRLADATFTARINTLGQKTMVNSTPVVLASDQSVIPVSQSGTWTVQPGNTANTTPWLMTINQGGNSATVTASNALKVDGSAVTQPVSGTVTVVQPTGTNLHTVVDSGSITVANATLAVTQSGTWTVGRTWSLTSGTDSVAAIQSGNWSVRLQDGSGNAITSTSNALDTNLKSWLGSTAPTVGQKTMANSVPIVIASDQTSLKSFLDILTSGTITALNGAVTATLNDMGSLVFTLTGTWTATIVAEGSEDNSNWINLSIFPASGPLTTAGVTTNGTYRIPSVGAYTNIRLRASAFTSGTVNVSMNASQVAAAPQLFSPTAVNAKVDALTSKEAQSFAGNTYGISLSFNITPANADNVAVYIKNPSGSGKTLVLQQIEIANNATSGGTSAADVLMKLFANPTSSANGTAATISTTSIGSSATTAMTAFTTPTVSANGTQLYASVVSVGAPTVQKDMTIFRVAPNNNLLITLNAGVNNTTVNVTVLWSEE